MPTTRRTLSPSTIQPAVITGSPSIASRSSRSSAIPFAPPERKTGRTGGHPEIGRAQKSARTTALGTVGEKPREVHLSNLTGAFSLAGKSKERGEGLAIFGAAELIETGLNLSARLTNSALRDKVITRIEKQLAESLQGRATNTKEKAFAGSLTLLLHLAKAYERRDSALFHRAIGSALSALEQTKDPELRAFYTIQLGDLSARLNKTEKARLGKLEDVVLPKAPPVEEWTENRTQPLEVRHFIHPEFWREELAMFNKKAGWTLVSKNANDSERVYKGKLVDPLGKKPALEVNMVVKKDELEFLSDMSDPKVHVITYSGHSSVGGNGGHAIDIAGKMAGKHPKLVFAANCRGKDNYTEFTNKWPNAHVIMTEQPTYSVNGQARLAALFDMLAAGKTYAFMRERAGGAEWEETKTNYFYPDEKRKVRFMDADEDGQQDLGAIGRDRLFDVDARVGGVKFMRGLNFTNSELFYHWEVDAENGKKSHYGKKYGDSLEAAGPFFDEKPGELLRIQKKDKKLLVTYAPSVARKMDENLLAGHVTMHAILGLAQIEAKGAPVTAKEKLRAALMGAQGIHYLTTWADVSPVTYQKYFAQIGLTDRMAEKDIENIFKKFDAHANDAQVEAFRQLLERKYGVDTEHWTPMLKRRPAHVDVVT